MPKDQSQVWHENKLTVTYCITNSKLIKPIIIIILAELVENLIEKLYFGRLIWMPKI